MSDHYRSGYHYVVFKDEEGINHAWSFGLRRRMSREDVADRRSALCNQGDNRLSDDACCNHWVDGAVDIKDEENLTCVGCIGNASDKERFPLSRKPRKLRKSRKPRK